jgi:hypothetical protein
MQSIGPLIWQQPNATEWVAAQRLDSVELKTNHCYQPYPWATWIDYVERGRYEAFSFPIKSNSNGIRATVCQHILAIKHLEVFKQAGITDLFWSHAIHDSETHSNIRLHPFPLYPVRCSTHPPPSPVLLPAERQLLYSFQGAYTEGLYLTPVRKWILGLPPRVNAHLELRCEWHYEQAVYREQVLGQAADAARHAQLTAEAEAYATTLQNSCFALCPSGSGPNSIRLWEALGYGAIPVILSDQLQLPGPTALWQAAALIVPETQVAVAALPSQLEALANDPECLLAMQRAGQELWCRYGLPGFVGDVVDLLHDPLSVLRARALRQLPPGDPLEIHVSRPEDLPLFLLRRLRDQPQQRSVLIQINDTGPGELLKLRWQAALRLCKQQLDGRPAAVVSVFPELEKPLGGVLGRSC